MPLNASQISSILLGKWQLDRQIKPGGSFTGNATFKPFTEGQLLYTEEGVLTTSGGEKMLATQSYVYEFSGAHMSVYFATPDQGLFQRIRWDDFKNTGQSHLSQASTHLCGQDLYETQVEFFSPKHFNIHHRVQGPKKNYISQTVYWKV